MIAFTETYVASGDAESLQLPFRQYHSTRGITIIAVLVSCGIIGLLAGLLIPASQWARERARSMQCRSHMKQLGIAAHSYEGVFGFLPVERLPHRRMLPHLGHAALYQALEVFTDGGWSSATQAPVIPWPSESLSMFVCPSDSLAISRLGNSSYLLIEGSGAPLYGPNGMRMRRSFPEEWCRFADVTDGLTGTAFMAEHLAEVRVADASAAQSDLTRHYWYIPSPLRGVGELDAFANACLNDTTTPIPSMWIAIGSWLEYTQGYNHVLPPNTTPCGNGTPVDAWIWTTFASVPATSKHSGGVNILFADGSVRFVASSVDRAVWRAAGSRNGTDITISANQ